MAPTPPPISASVLPRSTSSTPSLSVSSTASTDSQSVQISPSPSPSLSLSNSASSSSAPTITNAPTFSTGRFQSASPLSVSSSLSADVNDQIHVFEYRRHKASRKAAQASATNDPHSQQQKHVRAASAAARRTIQAC
ncbi:hypothetical protein V1515DRAFT_262562 [Lipomyces mesembrius]